MKKFLKIGGSIFAVGLLVFLIAFAVSGFDIKKINTQPPFKEKEYVSSSKIDSITIDDHLDVSFGKSPDNKVHIAYYENEKEYYEINKKNDLVFKKIYNYKWYDQIFNINFQDLSVSILIPSNFNGDIKVITNNGKIKSDYINVHNIDISTSNGAIDLNSLKASGYIKAKTSNGKINVYNTSANEDVSCSTSSGLLKISNVNGNNISGKTSNGKVFYSNLNAKNNISGETSNGKIYYTNLNAKNNITAETSNGKISIEKIKVGKDLNLKTSNGDISGSIIDKLVNFSITSKTSNGNNNLPENIEIGNKKLYAKTSNGDININFTQK